MFNSVVLSAGFELKVASGCGIVFAIDASCQPSLESFSLCVRESTRDGPALWAELYTLPARRVSCDAKTDSLETKSVCSSQKIEKTV